MWDLIVSVPDHCLSFYYVYSCMYACMRMDGCMYGHARACMYGHACACMNVCKGINIHLCICMRRHVCMYSMYVWTYALI